MNKIIFINIKTEEFYEYQSWDVIKELGGVKSLFKQEDYDDIYQIDACKETILFNSVRKNKDITNHLKCVEIYERRKNN